MYALCRMPPLKLTECIYNITCSQTNKKTKPKSNMNDNNNIANLDNEISSSLPSDTTFVVLPYCIKDTMPNRPLLE